MVEKENRSFIKQVLVTHYSRTPLRTAPSPCAPTRYPTCVSAAGLGPGHVPSEGLAERASWRSTAIWDGLLLAPPPLQKLALEGDSGAGRVSPSVAGGCAAVGRGKVAGSGVRAPTSAVKNSLAGCMPFARGRRREFFDAAKNVDWPSCMIRGESHSDVSDQKMAGEADLETVELL